MMLGVAVMYRKYPGWPPAFGVFGNTTAESKMPGATKPLAAANLGEEEEGWRLRVQVDSVEACGVGWGCGPFAVVD